MEPSALTMALFVPFLPLLLLLLLSLPDSSLLGRFCPSLGLRLIDLPGAAGSGATGSGEDAGAGLYAVPVEGGVNGGAGLTGPQANTAAYESALAGGAGRPTFGRASSVYAGFGPDTTTSA